MSQINAIIGLYLLVVSTSGWALSSDRNQPINIKADRVEINEKTEISHYQGNVHLKQGTLVIKADSVFVYMQKGILTKIIIDGKPATFEQQPEDHKDIVQSKAHHMEYYISKQLLILQQNAHITQGANNFSGDFIEYDTLNSTVKANKSEDGNARVHAIIQPKTDTPDESKPQPAPAPNPAPQNEASSQSAPTNEASPTP